MGYETGSLIVTSNQPFADWVRIFPDAMMTVAAVDRLTQHATIIQVSSDSYRRKEALRQLDAGKTTTPPALATTTRPTGATAEEVGPPDSRPTSALDTAPIPME